MRYASRTQPPYIECVNSKLNSPPAPGLTTPTTCPSASRSLISSRALIGAQAPPMASSASTIARKQRLWAAIDPAVAVEADGAGVQRHGVVLPGGFELGV